MNEDERAALDRARASLGVPEFDYRKGLRALGERSPARPKWVHIELGWRAKFSHYGYCREDASFDYNSPIMDSMQDALEWLISLGEVGDVWPVHYEPSRGLEGVSTDGWCDTWAPSDEWLVLSHPEFDHFRGELPRDMVNPSPRLNQEKTRELRERLYRRYGLI